eukprot:1145069-Pelagomonas_calceolata.AAC.1
MEFRKVLLCPLSFVLYVIGQRLVKGLWAYAMRKELTVDTSKSEVMHLSSKSCPFLPTFMPGNVALPQKDQFRYFNMLVGKHKNLKVSEEHAALYGCPAKDKEVYGIPAGMYACQVWGTEYLQEGREFKSQLQKRQIGSLRRFLGVKSTTTNCTQSGWPVHRECDLEPLQFYWFRATVKFFISTFDLNHFNLSIIVRKGKGYIAVPAYGGSLAEA